MTSSHQHIYRAIPGAGWACVTCNRPTVTPPPLEQRAAYQERLRADARNSAENRDYYDSLHDSIPSDVPSTVWESDAASKGAGA